MTEPMGKLNAAMHLAVSDTFASMAFMDVVPADKATAPRPEENLFWASLLIHDPIQSEIRLYMPEELITGMAETIYSGLADELGEGAKKDLIAELVNTLVGRFLGEILPPNRSFQLGLPETGLMKGAELALFDQSWHFVADGRSTLILTATELNQLQRLGTDFVI